MPTTPTLAELGDEHFVSLTTFRKSDEPVATTVWIARDGDDLIVTTPRSSGKVKRIRNNAHVELRACNRFGKVKPGAPAVDGTASILDDDTSRAHQASVFHRKLGFEYRLFMFFERRGKSGQKPRVMVRISAA